MVQTTEDDQFYFKIQDKTGGILKGWWFILKTFDLNTTNIQYSILYIKYTTINRM